MASITDLAVLALLSLFLLLALASMAVGDRLRRFCKRSPFGEQDTSCSLEAEEEPRRRNSIHEFACDSPTKERVPLEQYAGQVCLIVNVASRCSFTPQYRGLVQLHNAYKARGFTVLAFPCNDFGGQEPGSVEEIGEFCSARFGARAPG